MSDKHLVKLQEVFSNVFDIDTDEISHDSTMDSLDEWDSLRHLEVITSVEEAFGVQFDMGDIINLNSIEKISAAIQGKLEK